MNGPRVLESTFDCRLSHASQTLNGISPVEFEKRYPSLAVCPWSWGKPIFKLGLELPFIHARRKLRF